MIARNTKFFVILPVIFFAIACSALSRPSTPLPEISSVGQTSIPQNATSLPLATPFQTGNKFPLLGFISDNGIYTIDEVGKAPQKIFDIPPGLMPHDLSMSPDCMQYLYTQDMGGDPDVAYQLFHFSTETQKLTRLTDPDEVDGIQNPTWSPDGKKIAFWGVGRDRYKHEVHIMESDGTNLQRLSELTDVGGRCLAWSPDGTKFAYAVLDGEYSVYGVMNSDGTNPQEVFRVKWTNLPAGCVSWSPNSKSILMNVYHPDSEGTGYYKHDFAVVNVDGTDFHYITQPTSDSYSDEFEPDWSPDGMSIAFSYLENFERNVIYVMDMNDTNRVFIGSGDSPTWCSQR
jgi:Tol biopolymer transport system component